MNEVLALTTGLQLAYWLWNATLQPGMTRFSEGIGDTLQEIASSKLYRWFGAQPPQDAQGQVDESADKKAELIAAAQAAVQNDPGWSSARFLDTTKRVVVKLLRDSTKYSIEELQRFWQDFGDPGIAFNLLLAQAQVGDVHASIADRLVMEAIRREKLPQLIEAMREIRPKQSC